MTRPTALMPVAPRNLGERLRGAHRNERDDHDDERDQNDEYLLNPGLVLFRHERDDRGQRAGAADERDRERKDARVVGVDRLRLLVRREPFGAGVLGEHHVKADAQQQQAARNAKRGETDAECVQ
jgi:hypothetical protein